MHKEIINIQKRDAENKENTQIFTNDCKKMDSKKKWKKYCALICNPHFSTSTNPRKYKFSLKKERTKYDTTTIAPAIGYLA